MCAKNGDDVIRLNARQSKILDQRAQNEYGIPGLILMENAGLRAFEIAYKILKRRKSKSVLIFCGPGNNGGDGFVAARHLLNHNVKVRVFLLSGRDNIKGDALLNYRILQNLGARIIALPSVPYLRNDRVALNKAGLIIDAIFGIGLNKVIGGGIKDVIAEINRADVPVLSLDVPSGLCASTGKVFGCCIAAHTTVAFGAAKTGFYKAEGPKKVGKLIVVDISLPRDLLKAKS
ncbi:MAG: NAD(P)H-hydrate epimerase [Candidatus Omnitrophica bacterium]|nr:NAD(P)H-hydrate epimerase [Candidatus Omnitrophota bacterium]